MYGKSLKLEQKKDRMPLKDLSLFFLEKSQENRCGH